MLLRERIQVTGRLCTEWLRHSWFIYCPPAHAESATGGVLCCGSLQRPSSRFLCGIHIWRPEGSFCLLICAAACRTSPLSFHWASGEPTLPCQTPPGGDWQCRWRSEKVHSKQAVSAAAFSQHSWHAGAGPSLKPYSTWWALDRIPSEEKAELTFMF